MRRQASSVQQVDHSRVCNQVDCQNPPLVGRDFCSGQCAAKTVEEYEEISDDLFHFPGANIGAEYHEGFRLNAQAK